MPVSIVSREDRTYSEWFNNDIAYIEKYKGWVSDKKLHMYRFARRFIKENGDLSIFSDVTEWVWSRPSEVWAARIEGSLFEMLDDLKQSKIVTITNPYLESILIIEQWMEDFWFDVEGDEPISEDSDYKKTIIVGPGQTYTFKQGQLADGGVLVPYVLSLNASYDEIPTTYYNDLNQYPDWKAYFEQTTLNVINMDEWNPSLDFWTTGGIIPMYDPSNGRITGQGLPEWEKTYGDFTPTVDWPKDDEEDTTEEETDYTLWIVGGLIVVAIIVIYLLSRPKKVSTEG